MLNVYSLPHQEELCAVHFLDFAICPYIVFSLATSLATGRTCTCWRKAFLPIVGFEKSEFHSPRAIPV